MRKKSKIILSFFSVFFFLAIIANLPIIAFTDYNCHTEYESFLDYTLPRCVISCMFSPIANTITLSSSTLYAGHSATSSIPATSRVEFSLYNPSCTEATYIQSMTLTGNNITAIQSWDNNSKPSSATNLIILSSGHVGDNLLRTRNVTSFTYYPAVQAGSAQSVPVGHTFNYVINVANGQTVSGSLIAE